jgi:putative tricarboxylic transport membrane protein
LADRDLRRHPKGAAQPGMLRSSLIGTWIGILPGVGAQIGSVVAYGAERQFSKTPDKFGTGCEEGVVASEAANNATIGGALIPLIAMGIPGSVIDAILIGALMIHQLQPGPLLFTTHPHIAHAIMGAMLISTVLSYVMLTGAVKGIAQLMYLRRAYLFPVIIVFCVIGTYALNNRVFDVWVMLGFGVIGYCLERCRVPLGPFVIGLVLAPIPRSNCARD